MKFMIGCNYWGSESAVNMWKDWNEDSVDNDLKHLASYGVEYLRVFPNWRDFQPVSSVKTFLGNIQGYYYDDEHRVCDEFGINTECITNFKTFAGLAKKHNIKLIVSILTGWMSGRLFVPPALEGKNLIKDPEALKWEVRFVKGFVRQLKDEEQIYAWCLGNECNCMGRIVNDDEAYLWTALITNTIKSEDPTRKIMSGMHGLVVLPKAERWNIKTQAELTDVLCPHPYPSPSVGGDIEPMSGLRTTLVPTFQSEFYSGIGKKPAMVQETGTFAEMVGNKDIVADYFRINAYSLWANNSLGILWWCAHDQKHLNFPPYTTGMNERELGVLCGDFSPKPIANEMKKVQSVLKSMPFEKLPVRSTDAVCLITDNWGGDYMQYALAAYVMAKQAGFDMTFSYINDDIPQSDIYIVPCIEGWGCMSKDAYFTLFERAMEGASVYFSLERGLLSDFEEFFGLSSDGILKTDDVHLIDFDGYSLPVKHNYRLLLKEKTAEVLAKDSDGTVIYSRNRVGKGWFYFMNCPIEKNAASNGSFLESNERPYYKVYEKLAETVLQNKIVVSQNPNIGVTHHKVSEDEYLIVILNYVNKEQAPLLVIDSSFEIDVVYGNMDIVAKCDMLLLKARKKQGE